jgi:hypothetical protein
MFVSELMRKQSKPYSKKWIHVAAWAVGTGKANGDDKSEGFPNRAMSCVLKVLVGARCRSRDAVAFSAHCILVANSVNLEIV